MSADPTPSTARTMWQLFEPLHAVTYFAPEARAAADALGMRGFWMGYAVQRAAPLGAVGPAVATACFHGFHPSRLERALPDAWRSTTPEAALRARREGAVRSLETVIAGVDLGDAPDLAWRAAQTADTAGRPLAAANRALPRPSEPLPALWQATTTLREHRGDGHVAALVAREIGPVESHLIKTATGEGVRLQETRAWPDEEWADAADGLRRRGLLTSGGALTSAGEQLHREVEAATDALAEGPWRALGATDTERLAALLAPLADAVLDAGIVPRANPIGLHLPR